MKHPDVTRYWAHHQIAIYYYCVNIYAALGIPVIDLFSILAFPRYTWDFGDGTPEETTSDATISHTFVSEQILTVTLDAAASDFNASYTVSFLDYVI